MVNVTINKKILKLIIKMRTSILVDKLYNVKQLWLNIMIIVHLNRILSNPKVHIEQEELSVLMTHMELEHLQNLKIQSKEETRNSLTKSFF